MKAAGKVTVCGIGGTVAYTGVLATENKVTDWDLSDGADAGETKDGLGFYLTITSAGDTHKLTITLVPFDPSGTPTLATAKSKVVLPPKMGKVTIASTGIANVDGDWHYARAGGGTIKPDSSGQALKVTLPLERFDVDGTGPKYVGDPITMT